MAENPRKEVFKSLIMEVVRSAPPGVAVTRAQLHERAKAALPDETNDDESCYPGCKDGHPKWKHEFDRSIYDLMTRTPRLIRSGRTRGTYILGP